MAARSKPGFTELKKTVQKKIQKKPLEAILAFWRVNTPELWGDQQDSSYTEKMLFLSLYKDFSG
jgi:hypothetical protein